jgi:hypothetical protein
LAKLSPTVKSELKIPQAKIYTELEMTVLQFETHSAKYSKAYSDPSWKLCQGEKANVITNATSHYILASIL